MLTAKGYECQVPMAVEMAGQVVTWTERRLVVHSVRQTRAGAAVLRVRVAKAVAAIETFNRRGRGKKRFEEEVDELRQAVDAVLERYRGRGSSGLLTPKTCRSGPTMLSGIRQRRRCMKIVQRQ